MGWFRPRISISGWSLGLGQFAGIDVYVHVTFFALVAWMATSDYSASGFAAMLDGLASTLAIFGCVVLHEFGHALTARKFGIGTRDIVLLPIGGVARLECMPRDPWQELWITAAGPAVNVALSLTILTYIVATSDMANLYGTSSAFTHFLLGANIWLFLFNMLPAFPMDGGRILRSILSMLIGYAKATCWTCRVAKWMAVLFGMASIAIGVPTLALIAVFVWLASTAEMAGNLD